MSFDDTPPEGRLTHEQRARMRAGLVGMSGEPVRRSRPWVVPVAAAAAVGVLIAGATVAGLALSEDEGQTEAKPSGAQTSSPSLTPTVSPSLEPGLTTSCDQEARAFLDDATQAGVVSYAGGNTFLYTAHRTWLICDDWATRDGGPPTVLATHPLDGPVTKDLFLISQNYSMDAADGAQYFAGGDLIDSVSSISYSFPTGETVEATITDAMWSMVYLLPDAPKRAWTEPVVVTVTYTDGSSEEFELTGMDLCAQKNHGC